MSWTGNGIYALVNLFSQNSLARKLARWFCESKLMRA